MKGSFIMIIHYVLAWKLEVLKEISNFGTNRCLGVPRLGKQRP